MRFVIGIVLIACLASSARSETKSLRDEQRFELLTPARISLLPVNEQALWRDYLNRSRGLFDIEFAQLADEVQTVGREHSIPAPVAKTEFEIGGDRQPEWFGTEGAMLTDAIISFQTPSGGWSKGVDYQQGPRAKGTHWTTQSGNGWHYCGTLDNRSTTEQIRFLAWVYVQTQRESVKGPIERGLEWILAAQYPNGGWPQCYPVEPGYHEAITLNDNAMLHAMELLFDVAEGAAPFSFVDESTRRRSRSAFEKGLLCLGAAQVVQDGKKSVWAAQHDPLTLLPVGARKKEPPSLSGAESFELLKFLMRKGPTSKQVVAMVEPAVTWLITHQIRGLRKTKNAAGKTDYVADPASTH